MSFSRNFLAVSATFGAGEGSRPQVSSHGSELAGPPPSRGASSGFRLLTFLKNNPQADELLSNYSLERVKGVEPSSQLWKSWVLAVERHPQIKLDFSTQLIQTTLVPKHPKKKTLAYQWWFAPAFIVSLLFILTLLTTAAHLVVVYTAKYDRPLASQTQAQYLLNNLRNVLAAEVLAATPAGKESPKRASFLNFSPTEPVVYAAAVVSGSSGSGGSGQTFYGRGTPNNKFGMYVQNSGEQIAAAAGLVNSSGGDWGYVLLTMNLNDRGGGTWQSLFDAAAQHHVIPIIQLFNAGSCNPDEMDFEGLAGMLNELSWPAKHRYISIFNEVNAGDYWCGNASGESYAKTLDRAIRAFKDKSSDFFIMPAAFNSSARTGAVSNENAKYIGEDLFLQQMNAAVPGIFSRIDGWATHAYPQPNFSGSIYSGRDSILNYGWELGLLRQFGVGNLPVFITETGWIHREGQESCGQYSQAGLLSADTVAARYRSAYVDYWLRDARVVAVAPFIWNSNDPCAAGFAWQKPDGSLYPQAEAVKAIPKTSGSPS